MREMTQVIITAISSSGTGKTTNFVNIAYELGKFCRVKIIELDDRNSLSCATGSTPVDPGEDSASIFSAEFRGDYKFKPLWGSKTVELLQANRSTQKILNQTLRDKLKLKKILAEYPVDCDVLILDSPGAETALAEAAILACTHVILGIESSPKCFEDVNSFISSFYLLEEDYDTDLPVLSGFLVGKFNLDQSYQRQGLIELEAIAKDFECELFNPIRYSPVFVNAYAEGKPVSLYKPVFGGVRDYTSNGNFFQRKTKKLAPFPSRFKKLPAIVPYLKTL